MQPERGGGARTMPCPDCGQPVRPDVDQLCPRCGYPLMFLRTPAEEQAWPVARKPGDRDDATGLVSGTAPMRTVAAGPIPEQRGAPGPAGQLDCPRCGYRNEATRIRCERCGTELRPAQPVAVPLLPPPDLRPAVRPRWPLAVAAALAVVAVLAVAGVLVARVLAADTPEPGPPAAPVARLEPIDPAGIEAEASSTIPEKGIYGIENTLDGDPQTVWNSDGKRRDSNVGVELTYRFAEPVKLARITIVNGSAKNARSFTDNERIARALVRTEAAETAWSLPDSSEPQVLDLEPGETSWVTFVVEETYPGDRWPDLAVTEVAFDRQP